MPACLALYLILAALIMQYSFSYDKKKVIHALRRHFITRREIKIMLILVNVFAITSAVLYALHKIRPEPFFLGTIVWLFLLIGIFYVLPYSIYKKEKTFHDAFTIYISDESLRLENATGYVNWKWNEFNDAFESDAFFHLYFSSRAFFLLPKDEMPDSIKHEIRGILRKFNRK